MRVRWTEPAARDLTGIYDYTKEHSGRAGSAQSGA